MLTTSPSTAEQVARALAHGRERLLSMQEPEGFWRGLLETNVSMDAEDLLLRQFLGISDSDKTRRAAAWIRSKQRDDGSWSNFYGGPPNLSTTVEAYVALRLAGDSPDHEHMSAAARVIRDEGGLEQARVFTHIWLALFGLWSWDEVPALPPELVLLPRWFPLNPYDFACWARQTIVALSVVWAYRPVRPLPFGVDELRTGERPRLKPSTLGGRFLLALDRPLHAYERRPLRWLRRLALARAEQFIVRRQEADGSWGGIQPPWVYSLMALDLLGYPLDHAVMRRGVEGIESFIVEDGELRWLEACQSPVWDTALAIIALTDAGLEPDHPALLKAADWLLAEQVMTSSDWGVRRPDLASGGWAFEFENDNYPDVDDTSVVALALRRVAHPDPARLDRAVRQGTAWLLGMQSSDGGFAAFDADNTRTLCRELPFCDFGEVIDPPSADVTAHAVELLAAEGLANEEATRRAIDWLTAEQEPDGSWFGRWGANYVYGIGSALPALAAAGVGSDDPRMRAAVEWLERHQNEDGGWGEDIRSYDDPAWRGRGASTASQTAWALLALYAAGEGDSELALRGMSWLADTQLEDGSWDEPQYTGTGFPGHFYINYHLYRQVFPVMALGRAPGALA